MVLVQIDTHCGGVVGLGWVDVEFCFVVSASFQRKSSPWHRARCGSFRPQPASSDFRYSTLLATIGRNP